MRRAARRRRRRHGLGGYTAGGSTSGATRGHRHNEGRFSRVELDFFVEGAAAVRLAARRGTHPRIDVESPVHGLGLDAEGKLQVPTGERYNEVAWYDGSPTPGEVGPELRVITCGGTFDKDAGRHLDNVIVFAKLVKV